MGTTHELCTIKYLIKVPISLRNTIHIILHGHPIKPKCGSVGHLDTPRTWVKDLESLNFTIYSIVKLEY